MAPRTVANAFARDAYLAALEPPRFDLGDGRVLVGRILSADEWFRYEDRLVLASEDKLTRAGVRALMIEMTDLTFASFRPGRWPWSRATKVSTLLLTLPYGAQLEAFLSFIRAQAAAQTTPRARITSASQRDGTRSPA